MNEARWSNLLKALVAIDNDDLAGRFLLDIGTPAELEAFADRFEVAQQLIKKISYREISEMTGTSTATVTRVARSLHHGHHGYSDVLDKLGTTKGKKDGYSNKNGDPKKRQVKQ